MEPLELSRALQLKAEWLAHWKAEDGLGLINFGEERPPYPGATLKTASNDNGSMFRVIQAVLLKRKGALTWGDWLDVDAMIWRLRLSRGNFARNPKRTDPERLDNYCAIASAQPILAGQMSAAAQDIVREGNENGFVFNTGSPGKFEIQSWRQGADVAHYNIVSGYPPRLWELAWFVLGILSNVVQPVPEHCSELQMTWLRILSVEAIYEKRRHVFDPSWLWIFPVIFLAATVWKLALLLKTNGRGMEYVIEVYYGGRIPPNPIVELSRGVKF